MNTIPSARDQYANSTNEPAKVCHLLGTNRFQSELIIYWAKQYFPDIQFRAWDKAEELQDQSSPLDHHLVLIPGTIGQRSGILLADLLKHKFTRILIAFYLGEMTDAAFEQYWRARPLSIITMESAAAEIVLVLTDLLMSRPGYTEAARQRIFRIKQAANSEVSLHKNTLSLRQKEVLRYLAIGHTVKQVAALMKLSTKSVDSHKYRIMKKLGLHDRVHLAHYAIREGLIVPQEQASA